MERFTEREAAMYLSGLIDGEGSVSHPDVGRGQNQVQVANTDPDIIAAAVECLETLGVTFAIYEYTPRNPRWAKSWHIHIRGRENIIRLSEVLTLRSSKRHRLAETVSRGWKKKIPPSDEVIAETYRGGGSIRKMMSEYGIGHRAISDALKRCGVEQRSLSESVSIAIRRRDG